MKVKDGVIAGNLHPALQHALNVIDLTWRAQRLTATVTALWDGEHSERSLHYGVAGDVRVRAVDIRTRDIPADKLQGLIDALKLNLGHVFDVVVEGDHLHVEYDPKL